MTLMTSVTLMTLHSMTLTSLALVVGCGDGDYSCIRNFFVLDDSSSRNSIVLKTIVPRILLFRVYTGVSTLLIYSGVVVGYTGHTPYNHYTYFYKTAYDHYFSCKTAYDYLE